MLCEAVIEAAGATKPDEDAWERFGNPAVTVRYGRRLFVVKAGEQAEYIDYADDWGCTETLVIDL